MDSVIVTKLNETDLYVQCDAGVMYELNDYFAFEVPGHKFMPMFKNRMWDGKIRQFSLRTSTLPLGLYGQLEEFCENRNYEFVTKKSSYGVPRDKDNIDREELQAFIDSLELSSGGSPIEFRDYQFEAVYTSLVNRKQIVLSPTASGKSAIIYALVRWLLETDQKVLLVVPTTQLVAQMVGDFHDYSTNLEHDIDAQTHFIYAGRSKETSGFNVVVTTWQSIYKLDPDWFEVFDAVIIDEVHLAKATSLSAVLNKSSKAKYKIGFTGSLDKIPTHKQQLAAMFCNLQRVATTSELIEKGHLSDIDIKCVVLKYNDETNSLCRSTKEKKWEYKHEIEFLISHEKRNKFIRNLALSLKGNTLILFNRVEQHGKILFDLLKDKDGTRPIFFVHGGVDVDEREQVRDITEKSTNAIIVASVGVFSTGTNIKQLHNVVFASPTKSVIKVLQSIGRGLRKASGKDMFTLYDISDMLTTRTKKNFTYNHFIDRLAIYNEQEFNYKIVEIEIE